MNPIIPPTTKASDYPATKIVRSSGLNHRSDNLIVAIYMGALVQATKKFPNITQKKLPLATAIIRNHVPTTWNSAHYLRTQLIGSFLKANM